MRIRRGELDVLVMSYPLQCPVLPGTLTSAEAEIIRDVLRGLGNREIAAARGTAYATVIKQISSGFKKLGVHSRGELAARFLRTPR